MTQVTAASDIWSVGCLVLTHPPPRNKREPPVISPKPPSPQVIEMTQVTAASDIWSVGCLILELLTGYPPYYDLQPMSALFRIVQVRDYTHTCIPNR